MYSTCHGDGYLQLPRKLLMTEKFSSKYRTKIDGVLIDELMSDIHIHDLTTLFVTHDGLQDYGHTQCIVLGTSQ